MDLTGNGKPRGIGVIGSTMKSRVSVLRVRIPPGQSEDPQAGSEPCSVAGNRGVET
jgi:hypothetical protein